MRIFLLTSGVVSGGRNFSKFGDQCDSTYCFKRTDANCRTASGACASNINSVRWIENSGGEKIQ